MTGYRIRLIGLVLLAHSCAAADYTYSLRNGGFAIRNGPAYFNRPLFGTHEPSMLLSGDRPLFAYIAPTEIGKIGTLYIGIVGPGGGKWLHESGSVDFLYQPGLTRHELTDDSFAGGRLEVVAIPLARFEGFTIRLRWIEKPARPLRLVWAFGGASGAGSDYRLPSLERLHLTEADTERNAIRIWGDRFAIAAPSMKGRELVGMCDLLGSIEAKGVRAVLAGPVTAQRASSSTNPVALFAGDWPDGREAVHLFFTLSGAESLEASAANLGMSFGESVKHFRTLAQRVRVETPDPYLDLAFEAMIIANDGMWKPPTFVHGAVSWMLPYLGWRIWYGADALGFHERVRSSILAFSSRQIQRGDARGAIPDMLESRGVGYNMNEVFLDHVYYHYQWTGDRALLASLYPVIQGVLLWEKRRLDPDDNGLYESCLNTWISDSHWYSGGDTTQASAYMFRGHQLAAEAAEAAGRDPAPYRKEAERIRAAMNEKLWLADRGHYAEFIDRIGWKRIHTEPELPTIYHPIDFGVTDQFQAYQMLRFTETNLRNETGIPRGGRLVWSSNWAPNSNRTYTHSTHELAFAEELNLAIAYYRAGQFDKAYEIVKGVYASLYQGGVPGGLSCHAYVNGAQRRNEEFADGISLFARTVVEGLFGILPEMQRDLIHLKPGFPKDWNSASIARPDFKYSFQKSGGRIDLDVETLRPARIHYQVPIHQARATQVWLDGAPVKFTVVAGIGQSFVEVTSSAGRRSQLRIDTEPRQAAPSFERIAPVGEVFSLRAQMPLTGIEDPQGILAEARKDGNALIGKVRDKPGHHTLFVRSSPDRWEPVDIEVRPAIELRSPQIDPQTGGCRFLLRNNTHAQIQTTAQVSWAGLGSDLDVRLAPRSERWFAARGRSQSLIPGNNRLKIAGLPGALEASVPHWPTTPTAVKASWRTVPLDSLYNDSLPTLLLHNFWSSEYPYAVCCDYAIEHLTGFGVRNRIPDDSVLRAAVSGNGIIETAYGIPFSQRKQGKNLIALSRWKDFPERVEIPVEGTASRIYLLVSALVFPMQSHIANARITVSYQDGGSSQLDLVNPENLDNGLAQFAGTYHYTANGMVLLGEKTGSRPRRAGRSVLEQHTFPGLVWESDMELEERPHADIIDVSCDPSRRLRAVKVEVLSNEIIVAVLGVTLLE